MVDTETVMTRQLILKWFERAQIDYSDLYMRQYIAYNAWFRKVTGKSEDHDAIKQLLKRFIIWDDYIEGRTLISLGLVVEKIADFTRVRPVRPVGSVWNGVVKHRHDWKGLIYFWYQTRCYLFHGLTIPGDGYDDTQIKLAYESLTLFMTEIIKRMRYCFDDRDFARFLEVRRLIDHDEGATTGLRHIEARLQQKFILSPDIWNVDMERAS